MGRVRAGGAVRLLHEVLADIGACEESQEWAFDLPEQTSAQEAWQKCPNPLWLMWLLTEMCWAKVMPAKPVYVATLAMVVEGMRNLPKDEPHAVLRDAVTALLAWVAKGGDTDKLAGLRQDALIEGQMCKYRERTKPYDAEMRRRSLYVSVTSLLYSAASQVRPSDTVGLYDAAGHAATSITFCCVSTNTEQLTQRMRAADIVRAAVPWAEWEQALMAWAPTHKLIVE